MSNSKLSSFFVNNSLFLEDAYIINFLVVSHLWENEMAFVSTENFINFKLLTEKNVSINKVLLQECLTFVFLLIII